MAQSLRIVVQLVSGGVQAALLGSVALRLRNAEHAPAEQKYNKNA
jgi:hypothetical protein